MVFRNNSGLISTADDVMVDANNIDDVYSGEGGAVAFVIEAGLSGDDTFVAFGSDDSLITGSRIFDGNNDGFIAFGPNGVLDVDRFGGGNSRAGLDQFQLVGENDTNPTMIRYLGTKGDQHAYADANTLLNLFTAFGAAKVRDGDVSDDMIVMGGGARVLLQDNALGLNLGGDTVTGFGADDLFVTTSKLFDSDDNLTVTFGGNAVLDISGAGGPASNDPSTGPGGQVDFVGIDGLTYLGFNTINGVNYYYYGTEDTTATPGGLTM